MVIFKGLYTIITEFNYFLLYNGKKGREYEVYYSYLFIKNTLDNRLLSTTSPALYVVAEIL